MTVAGSRYGDSVMCAPQGMDFNIIAARYMTCWGIALARGKAASQPRPRSSVWHKMMMMIRARKTNKFGKLTHE